MDRVIKFIAALSATWGLAVFFLFLFVGAASNWPAFILPFLQFWGYPSAFLLCVGMLFRWAAR